MTALEITDAKVSDVAGTPVRRALPIRHRRTVGAWCFLDHMGPLSVGPQHQMLIGPHPHTGLHTVTWLLSGELVHRDSLGSEQPIRPGQLNLMSAGNGISHAEEGPADYVGTAHGLQLWVAQPEETRGGEPAFEHHASLPQAELSSGIGTLLIGELSDPSLADASPARADTELIGLDLDLRAGASAIPLHSAYEHAVVVMDGAVRIDGTVVTPGQLAYLAPGQSELELETTGATRAMLIGGVPFPDELVMWWNFVGRSREEISAAYEQWTASDERFGTVASELARIQIAPPPWTTD